MGQRGRPFGSVKSKVKTQGQVALDALGHSLRHAASRGIRDRHRVVRSVPFNVKHKFQGIPISELMHPPVPSSGAETESWFDVYMHPLVTGTGDQLADLLDMAGPDICSFVKTGKAPEERAIRLLWALGQADGAVLIYDHNSIVVHHDDRQFGIINGVVESRFCSGLKFACDAKTYLEGTYDIHVHSSNFCALWVEAHQKTRNEEMALVALLTVYPDFDFKNLLRLKSRAQKTSEAMLLRIERVLNSKKDPIAKLYKMLVPEWMTVGEFSKVFCPLHSRALTGLKPITQQSHITKMRNFFYKKNNKGPK